ncbi:unnamed protein product [Tilletia controversa]|uniref:Multicopper oxidase n=2 Tax=Tilletia TaxID=13289 RepID=A0A8T8TLV6_9BASI|nr:hypothetical protein CF335_g1681 [Tilletia laevis]KAE8263134.1 hypothetical protein A4X03_0g1908 [Tilletia caries]CAD6926954.1 unnamed protein product [Tilletia controversa]CAD6885203.1 unnamed protein product [Tilletia caries]CAD6919920.1 unnamed protein product [Tilletia caries]
MTHAPGASSSSTPSVTGTLVGGPDPRAIEKQQANVQQSSKPKRKLTVILASLVILLVILGLALGLGLGLGLRNRKSTSKYAPATGAVSSWTVGSKLPFVPIEELVDPSQFILSPTFDTHAEPQTREYTWDLTEVIAAPGGVTRRMLVVNGKFPGPTIEANLGDQIVVHVNNQLSNLSTIHWHGQYQNGSNYMDGSYSITDCGIAPGSSFTYNWTVQNTGTYWWHAHAGAQYNDGLIGALILHGPNDTYGFRSSPTDTSRPANVSYDGDFIMIVNDMYHLFSTDWLSLFLNLQVGGGEGDEPTPDYGVINGIGQANCGGTPDRQSCVNKGNAGLYHNLTVQSNQRYRMRVINAGALASFDFSVDGHPLSVIEVDSTPVAPTPAASVSVLVAQRTSFIIETNQTAGAYWIRATISEDMLAYDTPTIVKDQRAVMRYTGVAETTLPSNEDIPSLGNVPSDFNASALAPLDPINPPNPTMQKIVYMNFGNSANGAYHAFFNNTAFGAPYAGYSTVTNVQNATLAGKAVDYGGAFVVNVDNVEVLDIVINNQDDGGHPLHGYAPFLLGTGEGSFIPGKSMDTMQTFVNPMRRDTFVVPAYSWLVIRVVADNPGAWPFHCHLSSHMAAGLMMQFTMLPSKIAQFDLPADYRQQCAAIKAKGLSDGA